MAYQYTLVICCMFPPMGALLNCGDSSPISVWFLILKLVVPRTSYPCQTHSPEPRGCGGHPDHVDPCR